MLLTADDAADAVDGVADFGEDGAEVLRPPTILLEDDAKVAEGVAERKLLVAEEKLGRRGVGRRPVNWGYWWWLEEDNATLLNIEWHSPFIGPNGEVAKSYSKLSLDYAAFASGRPNCEVISEQSWVTRATWFLYVIDENGEECGAQDTPLGNTRCNGMRRRSDTLTADTNGSIGEEGLEPPPERTFNSKLSTCFEEKAVDPDSVKGFGEIEEGNWEAGASWFGGWSRWMGG
jgi:hypothetical protein